MTFFLCGKVQTDTLEERFGKYRQIAGSQYNISIRQVFESENKLRMQSVTPLVLKSETSSEFEVAPIPEDHWNNEFLPSNAVDIVGNVIVLTGVNFIFPLKCPLFRDC